METKCATCALIHYQQDRPTHRLKKGSILVETMKTLLQTTPRNFTWVLQLNCTLRHTGALIGSHNSVFHCHLNRGQMMQFATRRVSWLHGTVVFVSKAGNCHNLITAKFG
jgi:hypothetical protein